MSADGFRRVCPCHAVTLSCVTCRTGVRRSRGLPTPSLRATPSSMKGKGCAAPAGADGWGARSAGSARIRASPTVIHVVRLRHFDAFRRHTFLGVLITVVKTHRMQGAIGKDYRIRATLNPLAVQFFGRHRGGDGDENQTFGIASLSTQTVTQQA